jgi:hypothetical protein
VNARAPIDGYTFRRAEALDWRAGGPLPAEPLCGDVVYLTSRRAGHVDYSGRFGLVEGTTFGPNGQREYCVRVLGRGFDRPLPWRLDELREAHPVLRSAS